MPERSSEFTRHSLRSHGRYIPEFVYDAAFWPRENEQNKGHNIACTYAMHLCKGIWSQVFKSAFYLNSLWPSDVLYRHKFWSTSAKMIAWRLVVSNHYLNQRWLARTYGSCTIANSEGIVKIPNTLMYLKITYSKLRQWVKWFQIIIQIIQYRKVIFCRTVYCWTTPSNSVTWGNAYNFTWRSAVNFA